jgi:hypothetical protein
MRRNSTADSRPVALCIENGIYIGVSQVVYEAQLGCAVRSGGDTWLIIPLFTRSTIERLPVKDVPPENNPGGPWAIFGPGKMCALI